MVLPVAIIAGVRHQETLRCFLGLTVFGMCTANNM